MRLAKGISSAPVAGVVAVELCHSISQSGSCSWKKRTKCCCTAREPGVPGTRGIRMGASSWPLWMSKSAPAAGMRRRLSSDSVL